MKGRLFGFFAVALAAFPATSLAKIYSSYDPHFCEVFLRTAARIDSRVNLHGQEPMAILLETQVVEMGSDFARLDEVIGSANLERIVSRWAMTKNKDDIGYHFAQYFGDHRRYLDPAGLSLLRNFVRVQERFGIYQSRFFRILSEDRIQPPSVAWRSLLSDPTLYNDETPIARGGMIGMGSVEIQSITLLTEVEWAADLNRASAYSRRVKLGRSVRNILRWNLRFVRTFNINPSQLFTDVLNAAENLPDFRQN